MAPREAVRLSRIACETQGINPRHFKEPDFSYESVRPHTWQVFYESQDIRTWKSFFVYVDDQTRETRLMDIP